MPSSRPGSGVSLLIVLGGIILVALLYVTMSSSPPSASDEPETSEEGGAPVPDTLNTLSEAEREAGWQLLFDGDSTAGWRGYQRDSMPAGWTVEEGALHFEGKGENSTTIVTTGQYDHFELRLEWKIGPKGNSGIIYRATEDTEDPYRTGPEYQVLDNRALDDPEGSKHQAGALYGLYAPSEDATRPVGQYNEARIVVRGDHIEHWMNGTKLLEAEIGSEEWQERVAGTKFADWPQFAEATEGRIALQDHGHPVWFRDIKLLPLMPDS